MKEILKLIFCKVLKKHKYKDEMSFGMSCEGWDEFYICKFCGKTKGKYMD